MKIVFTTALIAAAPLAVAVALITASASPALACAAVAVPASAETLAKFTPSTIVAGASRGVTTDIESVRYQLADTRGGTANPRGRRDNQAAVTAARSCI